MKSPSTHLKCEALFVDGLEQAGAELLVHFDAGTKDCMGERTELGFVHGPGIDRIGLSLRTYSSNS